MSLDHSPHPGLPKKCTKCSRIYVSRLEWERLSFVGVQDSCEPDFDLELRNCPCGSTLSVRTTKQTVTMNEKALERKVLERVLEKAGAHEELLSEFIRENRKIYETLKAKHVMTLEEKIIGSIIQNLLEKAKEAA